jgi:hypothetical protein
MIEVPLQQYKFVKTEIPRNVLPPLYMLAILVAWNTPFLETQSHKVGNYFSSNTHNAIISIVTCLLDPASVTVAWVARGVHVIGN